MYARASFDVHDNYYGGESYNKMRTFNGGRKTRQRSSNELRDRRVRNNISCVEFTGARAFPALNV